MGKKGMWKRTMSVFLASAMLFTAVPVLADGFEREEEDISGFENVLTEENTSENGAAVGASEEQSEFIEEVEGTAEVPEQRDEMMEQEAVAAEETELLTASGTSGSTKWTLNASGRLVISGKGEFRNTSSLDKYRATVKHVEVKEGVTAIGNNALAGLSIMKTISLPGSLQTIGKDAFMGCQELNELHIPKGMRRIGETAFQYCTNLKTLTFDDAIKDLVIENAAFRCIEITELFLPSGVKELGNSAFQYCASLKEVTIAPGLEKMGDAVFYMGRTLTRAVLPGTIKKMGVSVFADCPMLEEVVLGEGLTTIGGGTFWLCSGLSSIQLPTTLKEIEASAFSGCSNLSEVRIPGFVEQIGENAFEEAGNLRNIYFEGGCPEIAATAFQNVTATVYYPSNMSGWTSNKLKNYGGTITWKAYAPQLRTPMLVSAENTSTGIKISWNPVSGASGYTVMRKTEDGSWDYIGRTTNTFYNNGTGKEGTAYAYTVRAYRGSFDTANENKDDAAYWSEYDTAGLEVVRLTPGKISSVTNAASSIQIKWSKVAGAKGYYIYKKTGSGNYRQIADVGASTLSYSDKDFKNGTAYTYAVRPYSGTSRGTYTGVKTYRLSRSLISNAKKSGRGKIALKWGKNVRVSGYQISYTTGSVTKNKTVSGNGNVSTTLTGLKAGKNYSVKVRGYKTVSGKKYYAGWSTAKTVKA